LSISEIRIIPTSPQGAAEGREPGVHNPLGDYILRIAGKGVTQTDFNIFEHAIDDVRNEPGWKAAREASINLCEKCRQSPFMTACGGGYLPHRFSRKNGYDNPSVYCDDLYAMFENMQTVLENHVYVCKPGGERLNVRNELARSTS
jgi:uncharacterized protein